jgi:site-specific DNA-methyltransferase (adenine-specific)
MAVCKDIRNGRLYVGDNVEVLRTIPDGVIDLTVTSPPYDNLRDYKGYSFDFESLAAELYRVTKDGGVVVWNVSDATAKGSETCTSFRQAIHFVDHCGFKLNDTMIWYKSTFGTIGGIGFRYPQLFEYMFVLVKGKLRTFNPIKDRPNKYAGYAQRKGSTRKKDGTLAAAAKQNKGQLIPSFGHRFNVWQINEEKNSRADNTHPAMFPIALPRDHTLSWSNPGDCVLDPFMGSGTTACAAIETGRRWVGCEISLEYADKSVDRIMNHAAHTQGITPKET